MNRAAMRLLAVTLLALGAGSAASQEETPAQKAPGLEQALERLTVQPPQAQGPPTLEDRMNDSLRRAVQWCLEEQKKHPDGGFGGDYKHTSGGVSVHLSDLFGLAVLASGGADAHSESVQKALRVALDAKLDAKAQYPTSHAWRVMVLAKLYPRLKPEQQRLVKERLRLDVDWILKAQNEAGWWAAKTWLFYTHSAVRALYDAEAIVGKELAKEYQEAYGKALKWCIDTQHADGGWGGEAAATEGRSMGSVTAATVASLAMMRESLFGVPGCPCGRDGHSTTRSAAVDRAIERGLEWLDRKFDAAKDPDGSWQWNLWCLGCQWMAAQTGCAYLGPHHWRDEMVPRLLDAQRRAGDWVVMEYTAQYAMLLAETCRWRPVLVNKLRFPGRWNSHPRDAANLVDYLSWPGEDRRRRKEPPPEKKHPLGWQAIPPEAPIEVWLDAPILYLSAESKLELCEEARRRLASELARTLARELDDELAHQGKTMTEEQKAKVVEERAGKALDGEAKKLADGQEDHLRKKLRQFTDGGGTVLLEASCGNRDAALWCERLCREVWPEWKLEMIDARHPLWSADVKMTVRPGLLGVDDGVRTVAFLSRADLSCAWNTNDMGRGRILFDLGSNLYAYSTDAMTFEDWRACRRAGFGTKYAGLEPTLKKGPKDIIAVATVKHGNQWDLCGHYGSWQRLKADLEQNILGLTLNLVGPVAPGEAVPQGTGLLYLCGRTRCDLGQAGPKWLKDYLAGGGFLFAEAVLGDPLFDEPLRTTLAAAALELKPLEPSNPVATGKLFVEAQGYDAATVAWSPALQAERKTATAPVLYGIYQGGKLVGIYSPYDILFSQTGHRAFGNRGYAACDARALATNLILLMTTRQ